MSLNHHPEEKDYWNKTVEVETSNGQKTSQQTFLLRVYPETFNGCDAYMDIPKTKEEPNFSLVNFPELEITWEVINSPSESPIKGSFRGDDTTGNPPAWVFGLKKL